MYADIPRGVYARDTRKCIAPTKEERRCRWEITPEEYEQARALKARAENAANYRERDRVLAEYILLRCCVQQHRRRLEHAPEVMDELIERYSRDTLPPLAQNFPPAPAPPAPPGKHATIPPKTGIFDRFVLYDRDPRESVAIELQLDIPFDYAKSGEVYFFVRPQDPEHLKIGYTGKTADERVSGWRKCYPDAFLGKRAAFAYPNRIERLIHLEMAEHRVKIVRCGRCNGEHLEWFRIGDRDAARIIDEWGEVAAKEPLYDVKGRFSKPWRKRMEGFRAWKGEESEVTARALLDFMDVEEDLDLIFLKESMSMLALDQADESKTESEVTILPLKGDVAITVAAATASLQSVSAEVNKAHLNEGVTVQEREISVEA